MTGKVRVVDKDRRASPRIRDGELTLRLNAGDFDAVTHTLNISSSGLYCKIDRPVPLMSKVRLVLTLPDPSSDEKGMRNYEVEGVVVRAHPVIMDGRTKHYDVAIFFDNLAAGSRQAIEAYIARKR